MLHTTIQNKVAKTGLYDGTSINIDGITGDWTVVLEIMGLTAGATARFEFEESTDSYDTHIADMTVAVTGQTGGFAGQFNSLAANGVRRFTFNKRDFPDALFGTTNAQIRLSLKRLTGSSPSVTYQSWIES